MMMRFIIFLFLSPVLYMIHVRCGQIFFESELGEEEKGEKKETEKPFSGYIKYEWYGDSYQVVGYQSDEDLQSPKKKRLDKYGKDIEARGQFMQNAIETRFRFAFVTDLIKELNSKVTAIIEADFFGLAVPDSELSGQCRFRHAYIQIERKNIAVLAGQFWNPTTILDCYANTISYDGGAPYDPSSRNPLITATIQHGNTYLILGLVSQLNFTSDGPKGYSNEYSRNAIVPDIHVQLKRKIKTNTYGIGYDIKRLVPRLVTGEDVKTNESLISHSILLYYNFFHEYFSFSSKYSFCQNGTDFGVYGGYAVHSIDPIDDKRSYTNISSSNLWFDVELHLPHKIDPGLFFGYTYNHGSEKTVLPDIIDQNGNLIERMVYGLDPSVQQSLRIQPRMRMSYGPVVFGLELEVTATAFGSRDAFARIHDASWSLNGRILGAIFYLF